jgi:HD-like signal output (HDOD) protein
MRRVVFVDDDPNVLSGLRRMLRDLRGEWDMDFAENADAALRLLEREPCDVLVTDMRMPGMDGVALLEAVRREFPDVVRIMLSGHTEATAAMRSVALAHRFLSKPCDPAVLRESVRRACELQERISDKRLRAAIGAIDTLPSPPHSTIRLNRLLSGNNVSVDAVTRIVSADAAIAAKLLQIVNSAFFGLGRYVTSIREAVAYLGINVVRNLVAAFDALNAFEASDAIHTTLLKRHHAHAEKVARVASQLAPPALSTEIFGIAMLHDIGVLALARCEAQRAGSAVRGSDTNHGDVGGYLLALWGLPYGIVETAARHAAPPESDLLEPVHLTHIAEAIVATVDEPLDWEDPAASLENEGTLACIRRHQLEASVERLLDDLLHAEAGAA